MMPSHSSSPLSGLLFQDENSIRSIAEAASQVMWLETLPDDRKSMYDPRVRISDLQDGLKDVADQHPGYAYVARQAEMISDIARRNYSTDPVLHAKASNLHADAATMAGSSTGTDLFTRQELIHLGHAKYHLGRSEGLTDPGAITIATEFIDELSGQTRVFVRPTEQGNDIDEESTSSSR